jgi:hypothetical protein
MARSSSVPAEAFSVPVANAIVATSAIIRSFIVRLLWFGCLVQNAIEDFQEPHRIWMIIIIFRVDDIHTLNRQWLMPCFTSL